MTLRRDAEGRTPMLHRAVDVRAPDDSGQVEVSFSSDEPYKRFDYWTGNEYWEVLGHKRSEIDLSRMKNGAPFLVDHDYSVDAVIGKVGKVTVADGKASATVKMAESERAQNARDAMKSGMLSKVSVGYTVTDSKDDGEIGGIPVRRVKWQPMEISLVAVPADDSVGVAEARLLRAQRMATETETQPDAPATDAKDAEIARLRAELVEARKPDPTVLFKIGDHEVTESSSALEKALAQKLLEQELTAKAAKLAPDMPEALAIAALKGGATDEDLTAANAQAKAAAAPLSGIRGASTDAVPPPATPGEVTEIGTTMDEVNARRVQTGESEIDARVAILEAKRLQRRAA